MSPETFQQLHSRGAYPRDIPKDIPATPSQGVTPSGSHFRPPKRCHISRPTEYFQGLLAEMIILDTRILWTWSSQDRYPYPIQHECIPFANPFCSSELHPPEPLVSDHPMTKNEEWPRRRSLLRTQIGEGVSNSALHLFLSTFDVPYHRLVFHYPNVSFESGYFSAGLVESCTLMRGVLLMSPSGNAIKELLQWKLSSSNFTKIMIPYFLGNKCNNFCSPEPPHPTPHFTWHLRAVDPTAIQLRIPPKPLVSYTIKMLFLISRKFPERGQAKDQCLFV